MKTKLTDIADRAGVDVSTVSRALRNNPKVRERTRLKIAALAKKMDYVPDWPARALSSGKSGLIGVILPEVKHSFYAELFEQISTISLRSNFIPELILTEFNPLRVADISRRVVARNFEGIIISGFNLNLSPLRGLKLPIVLIDASTGDINRGFDRVAVDNFAGAREAVKYLVSTGHQRIGFITDTVTTRARLDGYMAALKEGNIKPDENLIVKRSGRSEEVGYQAGLRLLAENDAPDAVFCVNDLIAIGLMKAAFETGLEIPAELSIVGFDDLPLSSYLPIPLATVRQPIKEIASESFQMLLGRMDDVRKPYKAKVLPTELIIRKTTANRASSAAFPKNKGGIKGQSSNQQRND